MADDRPGPSIERVREQLRRNDRVEPDYDADAGPDTERVTEVRERVQPPPAGGAGDDSPESPDIER